jgi:hypothetical protein
MHSFVPAPRPWGLLWLLLTAPGVVAMAAPATQPVTEPSAAAGVRNAGPLLPTDRPITLDEAIAVAYRNRADILIAQESLEAARQRVTSPGGNATERHRIRQLHGARRHRFR